MSSCTCIFFLTRTQWWNTEEWATKAVGSLLKNHKLYQNYPY